MSAQTDAQPALLIEGVARFERPPYRRAERAAYLRRRDAVGQPAPERGLREQVERAAAIRDRAADRREASVRRDEPFLHGSVARRPLLDARGNVLPCGRLLLQASSTSTSIGWITKLL